MTTTSDLDVALAAAQAGSGVLTEMFGTDLAREHTTATDFATAADRAAEAVDPRRDPHGSTR